MENRNLRILFLSSDFGTGGAGIAASRLASALEDLGHSVYVESILRSDALEANIFLRRIFAKLNRKFEQGLLRILLPHSKSYLSFKWLPLNPLRGIEIDDFDVIHIHWINYGFLGLNHLQKIVKKSKVPVFWTCHSYWPHLGPNHYPVAPSVAERFFADSLIGQPRNNFLKEINWIYPSAGMVRNLKATGNFSVLANPLPDYFPEIVEHKDKSNYVFIAAGDVFDSRKGLVELLNVWFSASKLIRKDSLLIVGPEWPHSGLDEFSRLYEVFRVKFLGEIRNYELLETIVAGSKAVIVPSFDETYGQVISEGITAGTHVILRESLTSISEFKNYDNTLIRTDFSLKSFKNALMKSEAPINLTSVNRAREELSGKFIASKVLSLYFEKLRER